MIAQRVAAAIADGEKVSWPEVSRLADAGERQVLAYLHWITSVSAGTEALPRRRALLPRWASIATALAVVQILSAAILIATSSIPPGARFRSAQWLLMASFAGAAAILKLGGRSDMRAQWLACVYVLVAASFSHPFLWGAAGLLAPLRVLDRLALDALIPVTLWRFAQRFPAVQRFSRIDRVVSGATTISLWTGLFLAATNAALALWPALASTPLGLLDRNHAGWHFWDVVYPLALPALVVPIVRTWRASRDERARVWLFTSTLAGGMMPILFSGLLEEFVPAVASVWTSSAGAREAVDAIVLGALLLVPPATTYAILTRQALSVRVVVERATRYLLARTTLGVLVAIPALALAWYLYAHRQQPLGALLVGGRGAALASWLLLSVLLLAGRRHLLRLVDRWFHSGPIDHGRTLGESIVALRAAVGVAPVMARIADEIARIFGSSVSVLRIRADGDALPLYGAARLLPAASAILAVARETHEPLAFQERSPILELLPAQDRAWLAASGVEVVLPLHTADGTPLAMLALTAKRDRFPWSERDLSWLTTMGGAAALALDNAFQQLADDRTANADWNSNECTSCGCVQRETACACGGTVRPALLPTRLHNKFTVERRVGSGGMGVVYRGRDVTLNRPVALKTLPQLDADSAARLRDEGRAMGALIHPNLAMIFGVEAWQRMPVLVLEWLEGGTLADRLRSNGRMPLPAALELARTLSAALDALHTAGIVHGDVKPSNIGFTSSGIPKLLDFGLAALTGGAILGADDLRGGTPLYLPPEAFDGEGPSPRFDLWALSLVLFETIAGTHPFAAPSIDEVRALVRSSVPPDIRRWREDVPDALADAFQRFLHPRREQRPSSAAEWSQTLNSPTR